MCLLEVALLVLCSVLLLPSLVLFVEIVAALMQRTASGMPLGDRPSVAVLMPAHNEESVIARSVASVINQLSQRDRLIVVADNCSDRTASLASAAGATVLVRSDLSRRGKGYALDFAVRHLRGSEPEVVVVLDADCEAGGGLIDRIAKECVRTGRPVQALYLMQAPKTADQRTKVAELAWTIKNLVRPLGLSKLGLACHLMGSGMAFNWDSIARANLATGHIVEDLKLGIDMACAGDAPIFCPDVVVTSTFPSTAGGMKTQRTRWEHGYLSVMLKEVARLFASAARNLDVRVLALALDLTVPPLALLLLFAISLWGIAMAMALLSSIIAPLIIASGCLTLLALTVYLAWRGYGRSSLAASEVLHVLGYVLWKVPVYARFIFAKQVDWIRSQRNGPE